MSARESKHSAETDHMYASPLLDTELESLCDAFVDANRAEFMDTDLDLPILRVIERVVSARLEEAAASIEEYATLRARTAYQQWFNPIAGARAQGRVAGLDKAAEIVRGQVNRPRAPS